MGLVMKCQNDLILYGSFHPSPRNVNTGRLNFEMMVDFLGKKKKSYLEVTSPASHRFFSVIYGKKLSLDHNIGLTF